MTDATPWTFASGGEVAESLEWLTDVLHAPRTAFEQRRRLRDAPRTYLEFEGLESKQQRRWMETQLHANGAGLWDVPLVNDTQALAAPLTAGSTTVPLNPSGRRFSAGGRALVSGSDPRTSEVLAIDEVEADSLTLSTPVATTWGAGSRLVPLRNGRLTTVPSLRRFTSDDVPLQLSWLLSEPVDWPADAGSAAYRGQPVLEWRPVWTGDPEHQPERDLDIVDELTGPQAVFDLAGIPLTRQVLQYVLTDRAQIGSFRSLLYALAGRWASIWVPTWAHDLRVVANVGAAAVVMDVEWSGLSQWPLQTNRRDIRIELLDGTVYYRRLTNVVQISSTIERVTLNSALGSAIAASSIAMVSFLALCRQDTDVNRLRWWDADVVQTELTFRSFGHDV